MIKDLLEWAIKHEGTVLPQSKMGKAIAYMLKLWKGLTRFLDDPGFRSTTTQRNERCVESSSEGKTITD